MNAIIGVAFYAGQNRLEKSRGMEAIGRESLLLCAAQNDGHFLRIRPEEPDNEIIAHEMRTKNPERIGMRAGEKNIDLVHGQTGYFEGAHTRALILKPPGRMSCPDFCSAPKSGGYL